LFWFVNVHAGTLSDISCYCVDKPSLIHTLMPASPCKYRPGGSVKRWAITHFVTQHVSGCWPTCGSLH